MKLTETQLRQIIREEIMRLTEAQSYVVTVFGPRSTWLKKTGSGMLGQQETVDDIVSSTAKKHGLKQMKSKTKGNSLEVEYSSYDKASMLKFKTAIKGIQGLHVSVAEFN